MSNYGVLDTRFRSALGRMAEQGRLAAYTAPVDPHLEVAAIMKKLDGGPALLFDKVDGYDIPVVGKLFQSARNEENRTELLMLITPYVIEDASQARAITEAVRRRFETGQP